MGIILLYEDLAITFGIRDVWENSGKYDKMILQFAWTEFKCPQCRKQISIQEVKQMEQDKSYKKIHMACIIDVICIVVLNELKIKLETYIGGIIGIVLFSLPFLLLLYTVSKDKNICELYRLLAKGGMYFWILCGVLAIVAEGLERLGIL